LDQVEDTHENKITYNYRENIHPKDAGSTYLNRIQYNNDNTRSISFSYEDMPFTWGIFNNGNYIKRNYKIHSISVNVNNILQGRYQLFYTYNEPGTRSYISQIIRYGKNGQSLPPTEFTYYDMQKGWDKDEQLAEKLPDFEWFSYDGNDYGLRITDLNKDGMLDFIGGYEPYNDRTAYLNTYGGQFTPSSSYRPPSRESNFFHRDDGDLGVRIADYNGDGYPDIIQSYEDECGTDENRIWKNTGEGWVITNDNFVTKFAKEDCDTGQYKTLGVELVDLNGDKYVDVLEAGDPKKAWINNKEGGWGYKSNWKLPEDIYLKWNNGKDFGTRIVDINGDNLPDIYFSDADNHKKLWLNNGNGWTNSHDYDLQFFPVVNDFDGNDKGMRFVDINNDGLTDVLISKAGSSGYVEVWINIGDKLERDYSWEPPEMAAMVREDGENMGTRMVDINGDGAIDIVRLAAGKYEEAVKFVWKNQGAKQSLLKKVKLSSGGEYEIEYMNSGETSQNEDLINGLLVLFLKL
jgi:hypothetical protein